EPKEEIGAFVDIYQRKMGNPALMFDEIPGFPKGHRVIANILTSVPRINVALGLPPQGSKMELIQWWRNYMKNAPSQKPKAKTSTFKVFPRRSGMSATAGRSSARHVWW